MENRRTDLLGCSAGTNDVIQAVARAGVLLHFFLIIIELTLQLLDRFKQFFGDFEHLVGHRADHRTVLHQRQPVADERFPLMVKHIAPDRSAGFHHLRQFAGRHDFLDVAADQRFRVQSPRPRVLFLDKNDAGLVVHHDQPPHVGEYLLHDVTVLCHALPLHPYSHYHKIFWLNSATICHGKKNAIV